MATGYTQISKEFFQLAMAKSGLPRLSYDEERDLLRKFQDGDGGAGDKLIRHHNGWIIGYAQKFKGYSVDNDDVVCAAYEGFSKAMHKFDSSNKARLSTYALWWMRAAVYDVVYRDTHIVKKPQTPDFKKVFYKLSRVESDLLKNDRELKGEVLDKRLADHFGVTVDDITMVREMTMPVTSMQAPVGDDDQSEYGDFITDHDQGTAEDVLIDNEGVNLRQTVLSQAFTAVNLKPRDLDIFTRRRLQDPPLTLDALAQEYGVSRERVRQIEVAVQGKIGKALPDIMRKNNVDISALLP